SCLATGVTVRVMHQHRDAGGRTHHVETTVTPLRDDAGTIVSFISMMTDYTEIRTAQQESEAKSCQLEELNRELTGQREQLARQAADLAAANGELVRLSAAKDEFVSTVSHELRTPLTAISESINLVADGSLGPLDENKTRFLNVATRNCSRLAELINDLLDLSKIEAGRMEASPAALDLGRILHESGETFAVSAGEKRVQLLVELPPGELLAFADERHVRRILANLLSNAVKFTRQGSVTLSAEPRNGGVVVTVADTGAGIPEREVGRIFEKFHQAPARDGSRPQGTGLGLAITRQMVELNKGRIWFETREGIGTRFHFSLPVSAPSTGGTSQ
ncbi:hypothetical protein FJY71_09610, partial [candidate division WOR-3 bacterium]|nr:hypothetical protein [candidate division WOR-3 bacterium]